MTRVAIGIIIVLVVLLVGTSAAAYVVHGWWVAADARADLAEADAKQKQDQLNAVAEEARIARERARLYDEVRRDVSSAPDSNSCAASVPVRAALAGLRRANRGPGGAPGAGGTAAPANRPR